MQFFKKYQKTLIIAVVGVALFLLGGSLVPNFLKAGNLLNVIRQSSVIAIAAVGMSQVIVIKGIDLSVGGNISFCGMVVGILFAHGVSVPVAILVALAVGVLLGLISGSLVAYLNVPAFVSTLVIGQITQGAAYLFNNGNSFGSFPDAYKFIGNGSLLGIPISDYLMVIFVALGMIITLKLPIGTHIYGLGGNEQVLKNAGIRTDRIKLFVFMFSGFCAASAGVLLAAQLSTAHPTQGDNYQTDAIAACVIGGVSFVGGIGKISGIVIGVLMLRLIFVALPLVGMDQNLQYLIKGGIILVACALDMRKYLVKK